MVSPLEFDLTELYLRPRLTPTCPVPILPGSELTLTYTETIVDCFAETATLAASLWAVCVRPVGQCLHKEPGNSAKCAAGGTGGAEQRCAE